MRESRKEGVGEKESRSEREREKMDEIKDT